MTRKLGPYEILEELTSGGMGAVLLARRRGPGAFEQLVAIKTIRPEYASAPAVRAMFLDEAAILARLAHPAVATVHDFGDEGGTLYMVMEYVAGIRFRDVAERRPPPGVIARAIAEACRGLHAAHELRDHGGALLGVVHRDISPDNLMLGYDGHVKVIDFGIALVKNRATPVTEIGTLKGKPPYMSPEQVKNEAMDRRSDVFSLGVVAWEMLTGQGLFHGDSLYAVAMAVERQAIPPPSAIAGELPRGLDAAVLNALDRDLTTRTPSAAALAEQLEGVIGAAGSETLEAWAERALDGPRLEHRAWLARATTGGAPPARPVGRATGMMTAVVGYAGEPPAAEASAALEGALEGALEAALEAAPADVLPTHHAPEPREPGDSARPPVRRRIRASVVAVLALLGAGGAVVLVATRGGDAVAPAAIDARAAVPADAQVARPAPADALVVVPVPADAALPPPLDAGRRVTIHADAAPRVVLDAAAPDAPPAEPALTGTALVAISADPYANIVIDGVAIGPTPKLRQVIPAGHHVIKLLDPTDGHEILSRSVTLHDGDRLALHP